MRFILPGFRSLQRWHEPTNLDSHFSQWTEVGVSHTCFFCHFRCLSWEETDCILALPIPLHWLKATPRQLAGLWNSIWTNAIPFPDSDSRIPLPNAPTPQSIISEENYFSGSLIVGCHLINWLWQTDFRNSPTLYTIRRQRANSQVGLVMLHHTLHLTAGDSCLTWGQYYCIVLCVDCCSEYSKLFYSQGQL